MNQKTYEKSQFRVGQNLLWTSSTVWRKSERREYEVEIVKVGREYLHLSNNRKVLIHNLVTCDDHYQNGQCFLSKEEYDRFQDGRTRFYEVKEYFAGIYWNTDANKLSSDDLQKIHTILKPYLTVKGEKK